MPSGINPKNQTRASLPLQNKKSNPVSSGNAQGKPNAKSSKPERVALVDYFGKTVDDFLATDKPGQESPVSLQNQTQSSSPRRVNFTKQAEVRKFPMGEEPVKFSSASPHEMFFEGKSEGGVKKLPRHVRLQLINEYEAELEKSNRDLLEKSKRKTSGQESPISLQTHTQAPAGQTNTRPHPEARPQLTRTAAEIGALFGTEGIESGNPARHTTPTPPTPPKGILKKPVPAAEGGRRSPAGAGLMTGIGGVVLTAGAVASVVLPLTLGDGD